MSFDKNTLELAAYANGRRVRWHAGRLHHESGPGDWAGIVWDPSVDDGDCARMEADLDLNVVWMPGGVQVYSVIDRLRQDTQLFAAHHDKQAARRFAAVMVAAELGRLKP